MVPRYDIVPGLARSLSAFGRIHRMGGTLLLFLRQEYSYVDIVERWCAGEGAGPFDVSNCGSIWVTKTNTATRYRSP